MKILIVAATWMEVKLLVDEMELIEEKSHFLKEFRVDGTNVDILVAGIGSTFTAFHLTSTLKESKYDFVFNIGIAGSLIKGLGIGEVVNVITEEFADLGIEKENEFLTLFETGFIDSNEFPFVQGIIKATDCNGLLNLKKVRGITTNKIHGRDSSIAEIQQKFLGHIESMEGAAVFYICNWMGIPCCQIRAISNYIDSDKSAEWDIPLALENLKNAVLQVLKKLAIPVN